MPGCGRRGSNSHRCCACSPRFFHLVHQLQQCARRRILLRGVVNLPGPCAVLGLVLAASRAASATRRKNTFTPIEKFGLHTSPMPLLVDGCFGPGRSPWPSRWCRPPVLTPSAASCFDIADDRLAESRNRSRRRHPRKFSAVMPSSSALLNSSSFGRLRSRTRAQAARSAGPSCRSRRWRFSCRSNTAGSSSREELGVQRARRRASRSACGDHEADVQQRRALARSCGC